MYGMHRLRNLVILALANRVVGRSERRNLSERQHDIEPRYR
jgi:hypothetical protein